MAKRTSPTKVRKEVTSWGRGDRRRRRASDAATLPAVTAVRLCGR